MANSHSPRLRRKLAPIHAAIKAHTNYKHVYANKRSSSDDINVIFGHRIKYFDCNPTNTALVAINYELEPLGLKAVRYQSPDAQGDAPVKCLVIRKLTGMCW